MIVIPVFDFCIALAIIIIGSCIGSAAFVGIKLEKVTKERDAAWRMIERIGKNRNDTQLPHQFNIREYYCTRCHVVVTQHSYSREKK